MARTVGIGIQDFEKIIKNHYFYVDKTNLIKEWWETGDDVTLITRPRRFGKTLNLSMLDRFFSNMYDNQEELFRGLSIWEEEEYRGLAGSFPVISLSFAGIKDGNYLDAVDTMYKIIKELYRKHLYLMESDTLSDSAKKSFYLILDPESDKNLEEMEDEKKCRTKAQRLKSSIHELSEYMAIHYGKKVLILLDEYDTPMQEAYVSGYWDEFTSLIRGMFNVAFKTNPYLDRAILTGITRVSKESIFSDLNNLAVVTTTSDRYATCFGLTEKEVFAAMDEQGLSDKEGVKLWYDGFTFGSVTDIYNPWSIISYLKERTLGAYWANTSSNSLVGKLIREGSQDIKLTFERLLDREIIIVPIDEQIVYNRLNGNASAVWSLLLATGYLKVISFETQGEATSSRKPRYELKLTNEEVMVMFRNMVTEWFETVESQYNDFIKALLLDDTDAMNEFMEIVSEDVFSFFDTGKRPGKSEPERFYHGFVLGLMVDMSEDYIVRSNRESGFGRYDVMIYSKDLKSKGIIIEFKVHKPMREKNLEETVQNALKQIEEKDYGSELKSLGFAEGSIKKYGFAFEGKKVLIGKGH